MSEATNSLSSLLIFNDVIGGEIVSGWMITSLLTDMELEMKVKLWFRKHSTLRIRKKEYNYSKFMRCLTNSTITTSVKDDLVNIFSDAMNDGGDSFGLFPIEVITEVE